VGVGFSLAHIWGFSPTILVSLTIYTHIPITFWRELQVVFQFPFDQLVGSL
jgi:hypothetical protein